jgi:hypothetical protein
MQAPPPESLPAKWVQLIKVVRCAGVVGGL